MTSTVVVVEGADRQFSGLARSAGLTVISTIFMPLGFIAGLYGMNFDPEASRWNMPELEWAYGYPMALALMAATAGAMLVYFRRRGWWR